MSDERMHILRMIEEKRISPDEGVELLEALSAAEEGVVGPVVLTDEAASEVLPESDWPLAVESAPPEEVADVSSPPPDLADFRHLWLIPLAAGVALAALSVGVLVVIQLSSPGSFFLICGILPLLLGLVTVLLAFWSRTARWLHVRIRGEQRISLSFPLPLRLTAWVLRLARPFVPQLAETGLDEVILSLDEGLGSDQGFYVDVHDDAEGEHVQVYIG